MEITIEYLENKGFERNNFTEETKNDYWFHKDLGIKNTFYLPYKTYDSIGIRLDNVDTQEKINELLAIIKKCK
jgi:hypothetical protein